MVTLTWVAGGRDYDDHEYMLDILLEEVTSDAIITGAASGADLLAEEVWRESVQFPYIGVPARWRYYGKSAGYRRNLVIARDWKPEKLIALPGGRGTDMALELANKYDIEIVRG